MDEQQHLDLFSLGQTLGSLTEAVKSLNNNVKAQDKHMAELGDNLKAFIAVTVNIDKHLELVNRVENVENRVKMVEDVALSAETTIGVLAAIKRNWVPLLFIVMVSGGIVTHVKLSNDVQSQTATLASLVK